MRTPVLDVFRPFVWLSARVFWGIRFEGLANIPAHGPLLVTPNHVTFADPPLVSIPIRRAVHYMAWDRLFQVPGLSWLIRRLRAFPVDIDSADPRATRAAVRLLDAGQVVMIFPEAGRSHDGRLQRFKLGAFRLACAKAVPVLPVTILGGHESWPPGRALPRPGRLTIIYHQVITPPADHGDLRHAARELADRVREAVASRLPAAVEPPAAGEGRP